MATNSHGEDFIPAEADTAALLSPNLESRLRLAVANVEQHLREVYAAVTAVEEELLQVKNVIGRAERVPVQEAK